VAPATDPTRGVYGISVAADMVGVGVQSLRSYEKRGLLAPSRTDGGTRLYSDEDLTVIVRISELLAEGLNLAGVEKVLQLESANSRLRAQLDG
jgi:MerR family transcriptional regulator, heat shock protein HspR